MVSLYEHQRLAVNQLRNGTILCGGVGSGKSRTSLAYFYEKVCGGDLDNIEAGCPNPKDLYIITPASKRDKLEWEIKECSIFCLGRDPQNSNSGIKVTVDSWNNISKYCNVIGAFFIFDEQKVTGSGPWVRSFYQIAKKNKWIILSATPGDNWIDYIPVFVANGFYKNRTQFIREHVIYNMYTKYPKIEGYVGIHKLIKLKEQVVIKMECVKPTVMHEEIIQVGYNRKLYEYIIQNRWNPYENRPIKNISELCYLLRRATNEDESRIDAVTKIVSSTPKIIIFYNHDYELDILRSIGSRLGVYVAERNGHKHMPIPKYDQWMYIVQYASGAEAWNCIETNVVLMYSLSYSYKATVQAAGRIDRLDTPFSDLYCKKIVSDSPIDKRILECLDRKENFNEGEYYKGLKIAIA